MSNTDRLFELIEKRSKEQLSCRLAAEKLQTQQDLNRLNCYLISIQSTNIVMAGLNGMSDGKDNKRYQSQFLGGGNTAK